MTLVGSAVAATFVGTAEDEILATGLATGDTVVAYKVVEWDAANSEWKLTTLGAAGFTNVAAVLDGISSDEATAIANAASGAADYTLTETSTTGTFHVTGVAAGMYYLKATPADRDTIYNPAFVSADYYQDGNTVEFSDTMGNAAYIKKSTVPFEKEVNDADKDRYMDVKPGDTIPYKITTTIPAYGKNFTNPKFTIVDVLSAGLELDGTITVKYGTTTVTASDDNVTITAKNDKSGYTVDFAADYLKNVANKATVAVEITYSAKVTTAALDNVTYMDNKATLTFSHTPDQNSSKDDITRHYTFSIDGNLLGSNEDQTDELIKVACNPDGTPLYDQKTTYYDKQVNPLDGASFTLTPVDGTPGSVKTYKSADGGHIQFLGLDAGTYELVETQAPAGYTKDSRTYIVKIIPHYNDTDVDNALLISYDVEFSVKGDTTGAKTTSTFNTTNEGGKTIRSAHAEHSQPIGNTPGNELPSTGGIGTTIFYIAGLVLVLGAAAIVIARRKAEQ